MASRPVSPWTDDRTGSSHVRLCRGCGRNPRPAARRQAPSRPWLGHEVSLRRSGGQASEALGRLAGPGAGTFRRRRLGGSSGLAVGLGARDPVPAPRRRWQRAARDLCLQAGDGTLLASVQGQAATADLAKNGRHRGHVHGHRRESSRSAELRSDPGPERTSVSGETCCHQISASNGTGEGRAPPPRR